MGSTGVMDYTYNKLTEELQCSELQNVQYTAMKKLLYDRSLSPAGGKKKWKSWAHDNCI